MPSDSTPKEHMYVSWHDVELQVKVIIDHLVLANAKPHVIMAVGFGGLIPASMIAYQYGQRTGRVPLLDCIYAHSYKGEVRGKVVTSGIVAATERHPTGNSGYMLIVDDIADSGETLRALQLTWPLAHTATLIYKEVSSVRPDYFGHLDIDGNKWWYVWPWEAKEPLQLRA